MAVVGVVAVAVAGAVAVAVAGAGAVAGAVAVAVAVAADQIGVLIYSQNPEQVVAYESGSLDQRD